MKVVILAGGKGSRLSEETDLKPKPMVEIGGKPILWHIMKIYIAQGYNDFIIATGYKRQSILDYFTYYWTYNSKSLSINLQNAEITVEGLNEDTLPCKVTIVNTGQESQTGHRLAQLKPYLESDSCFMLTYGDGVSTVSLTELYNTYYTHDHFAGIVTAVHPSGRLGKMEIEPVTEQVTIFSEKPLDDGWINGGFFVFSKSVFEHTNPVLYGLQTPEEVELEKHILTRMSKLGLLGAYLHKGFWACMDTPRDKKYLEDLWNSEKGAPWKIW